MLIADQNFLEGIGPARVTSRLILVAEVGFEPTVVLSESAYETDVIGQLDDPAIEIGSASEIRTLGFLGVGEALWPLS